MQVYKRFDRQVIGQPVEKTTRIKDEALSLDAAFSIFKRTEPNSDAVKRILARCNVLDDELKILGLAFAISVRSTVN